MKKIVITHTLQPHFYDVDSMNVVWHGNYIKYFEHARSDLFDHINYNYYEMKESGYVWPIVSFEIKYIKPIFLHQEIEATLVDFKNRLKIEFKIFDKKTKTLLTKASSSQVAVKMGTEHLEFETPLFLQEKINRILSC